MRSVYARAESAISLSASERVVGCIERPGLLAEYVVGERPRTAAIRNLRRALPSSILAALAVRKPMRLARSRRLTHAGRERKRRDVRG